MPSSAKGPSRTSGGKDRRTVLRLASLRRPSSRPAALGANRGVGVSAGSADIAAAIGIDVKRFCAAFHDFTIDYDLTDPDKAGQLEHRVEKDRLHDRA